MEKYFTSVEQAQFYLNKNELDESIKYCYQAILINPYHSTSYSILASALRKKGFFDLANRAYSKAHSRASLNLGSELALSQVFSDKNRELNLQQAIQNCLVELDTSPDNVEIQSRLNKLIAQQLRPENQLRQCQQHVQLQPRSAKARLELGKVLVRSGKLKEAETTYRCAIELQPSFAEAYWELGKLLQQQDKLQEALPLQRKALELQPNLKGEVLYDRANRLAEGGRLDEAISCYQQALLLQPNLAGAYWNLGKAFQKKGETKEARNCQQKAISIDSEFLTLDTYFNLGKSFEQQNRRDEALSFYQRVIRIDPNCSEAVAKLKHLREELFLQPIHSIERVASQKGSDDWLCEDIAVQNQCRPSAIAFSSNYQRFPKITDNADSAAC